MTLGESIGISKSSGGPVIQNLEPDLFHTPDRSTNRGIGQTSATKAIMGLIYTHLVTESQDF